MELVHEAVQGTEMWRKALEGKQVPENYSLTKVLVLKPKAPKSQPSAPVVVVALDSTNTPSGVISKALDVKEARLASADLIHEVLDAKPENLSIYSIDSSNARMIQVVLDQKLLDFPGLLAFHKPDSTKTVFVEPIEVQKHLDSTCVSYIAVDFTAAIVSTAARAEIKRPATKNAKEGAKIEGAALIGITIQKQLDFSGWYQQILLKGDMLEYYDVSGCYIMRPWSYCIWEGVQRWLDDKIKGIGVENAYFPMFVSSRVLEREKEHIEGFAPEVAWVTKAGSADLEEPVAIRPTSETVMYPYYAKWIRSHRDLPLRLNQWNSVVRWEFKHPQPFLRTREFLWQEGHTAHLTQEEATKEVLTILEFYAGVYEELLAVPVIKGRKTEKEKFAGGLFTTTCEGYIPGTGRGIQGATSHCLGQNFSKMFNIVVEDPNRPQTDSEEAGKLFVWQNSWGLSTRVIGVMAMIHGDNKGLVLPPRVAQYQVVIVPCGITAKTTEESRQEIYNEIEKMAAALRASGIRVNADLRDVYSPGYKFNAWEMKGVPLRLEFGPADLQAQQFVAVRRDTGEKAKIPLSSLADQVRTLLSSVQQSMFDKAKASLDSHIRKVYQWADFVPALNNKDIILMPWCGNGSCEDDIKERSARRDDPDEPVDEKAPSMGAKSLCIPFEQPDGKDAIQPGVTKCTACGENAKEWCLFGRSY